MDITVPGGVGGVEAVERLVAVDPEAKVIVSSGYSTDPVMACYEQYGFVGKLVKPYRIGKKVDAMFFAPEKTVA